MVRNYFGGVARHEDKVESVADAIQILSGKDHADTVHKHLQKHDNRVFEQKEVYRSLATKHIPDRSSKKCTDNLSTNHAHYKSELPRYGTDKRSRVVNRVEFVAVSFWNAGMAIKFPHTIRSNPANILTKEMKKAQNKPLRYF